MNKRKIIVGIAAVLLLLAITGAGIAWYLITRSFPDVEGSDTVAGLSADVRILRDAYGVPHIEAASEDDAYMAVGYVHAQDRLWQMELERRAATGTLSEILGEKALPVDKLFRTLGVAQLMPATAERMDPAARRGVESYVRGVNEFIATHRGKYPIEFDMLDFEPQPWTVEHVLLISKLMAWELNYGRWIDLMESELVRRVGPEMAREVFPSWPADAPTILPGTEKIAKTKNLLGQLIHADGEFRKLFGGGPAATGSNAWAVSGFRSATGKPILANDPHLLLTAPGQWYEVQVRAPGLAVEGATIPGVPFAELGRNERIAWGVTNAMLDDEDFFVEEVDSTNHPTRYRFNGAWRPIAERVDTILVKGSMPVLLSVYSTHRGPIVNRFEAGGEFFSSLVSMRWTGHDVSDDVGAFYRVNHARSWQEFTQALKRYGAPAQNFVYADVDGHIGYCMGGRIPLRPEPGPTLPFSGVTDRNDWKGYVPFESNPRALDPPSGIIVTANNRIVPPTYPYHLSNHYEPPWRAERINRLLSEQPTFDVRDMQRIQSDLSSIQAEELVPIFRQAYDTVTNRTPQEDAVLTYWRNWTFDMGAEDVSTTLFESTVCHLITNTFEDEMGPELLALYDTLASTPMTTITEMAKKGTSRWFDDIRTPEVETRDDMIRKSVRDAIVELSSKLGTDMKEWRWGRVHPVKFAHVFGLDETLGRIFNVGPYPMGGSHSTVSVGYFFLSHPYESVVGSSTRMIYDLSDADNTLAVVPPGQSGQVFSAHYSDQAPLWLNRGYRRAPLSPQMVESSCSNVLILKPAR